MRLAGRRALITGGGSGIGRASAELFVREGAAVVVSGRPTRPSGMCLPPAAWIASQSSPGLSRLFGMSVAIRPGHTALTRIRCGA